MATGNVGREGVGVNPMRGQNNVQGSCDMGSFPHELPGYRHVSDSTVRAQFEADWGVTLQPEPGLRIANMFDAAMAGSFRGLYCQGEDIVQSDPDTQHVARSEEHTSELQSLMRISYAVFCLKKKKPTNRNTQNNNAVDTDKK